MAASRTISAAVGTPLYRGFMSTHANCRNHLLYHGPWQYCT